MQRFTLAQGAQNIKAFLVGKQMNGIERLEVLSEAIFNGKIQVPDRQAGGIFRRLAQSTAREAIAAYDDGQFAKSAELFEKTEYIFHDYLQSNDWKAAHEAADIARISQRTGKGGGLLEGYRRRLAAL